MTKGEEEEMPLTPHLPYDTIPVTLKLWDGPELPPNEQRLDRYDQWIL